MKKTLIAIAAAATVSLGAIGAASAAPGLDITAKTGVSTQEVGYRYNRFYGNYGYYYQHCKRLYYKGWVLDYRWAQIAYLRHCRYKYNY